MNPFVRTWDVAARIAAAPLGRLHSEARVTHTDGFKTYAVGHIADATGITVEAEAVFIEPRWARG